MRFSPACCFFLLPLLAMTDPSSAVELNATSVELSSNRVQVRAAQLDNDNKTDLLALQGNTLYVLLSSRQYAKIIVALPPKASWLDTAVLETGEPESLIVFTESECYAGTIASEDPFKNPLFTFTTPHAPYSREPVFRTLTVNSPDGVLFALPRTGGFELVDRSNTPVQPPSAQQETAPYGIPFQYWNWSNSLVSEHGLGFHIDASMPFTTQSIDPLPLETEYRPPTVRQAMDARFEPVEDWPWLPLTEEENVPSRIYFAYDPPRFERTRIRIRRPEQRGRPGGSAPFTFLPERVFPGRVVITEEPTPDFNRDGFRDLLLWSSPLPGRSVDSIMRTLQDGGWPLYLTVRLFAPERQTFESRGNNRLKIVLPLEWFWEGPGGTPLRNLVLRDFNEDGQADLGLSLSNTLYAVWIWNSGFSERPTFFTETEGPHRRVVLRGAKSTHEPIVLQSDGALTIIAPMPSPE